MSDQDAVVAAATSGGKGGSVQMAAIVLAVISGLAGMIQSRGSVAADKAVPAIEAIRVELAEARGEIKVLETRLDYLERGRMGGPVDPPDGATRRRWRDERSRVLKAVPKVAE